MLSSQEVIKPFEVKYKLVAPDGGWGHFITISVTIVNFVSVIPAMAFGLLYGQFLKSVGDETTGTAITNGVFNTVQSFTGLASNFLLQKYNYREVGLVGATLYLIGAITTIFITNLTHLIISFGILQGLGFGLMLAAALSAFNCYFDKRLTLMMSIAQAIITLGSMASPPIVALLVDHLGFRGALAILAVSALLNFPAMGVLQPVDWHVKQIPTQVVANNVLPIKNHRQKSTSLCDEVLRAQIQPLLSKGLEDAALANSVNLNTRYVEAKYEEFQLKPQRRFSIISLGDRTVSVTSLNGIKKGEETSEERPSSCMDLGLLKDLKYLNISCGISLSYTADVAFCAIIPMILTNVGFSTTDVAFMMMVYFGSDLVSRISISVVSAVFKIRSRYVFLAGSFLSGVFRIAFVLNDTYIWKMVTLGVLGFLRCLIQTPLALVISEEYNNEFPTAFSLYMVVCGIVSLIFGPLMSFVKSVTQSDAMVVHLLTVAYMLCSISWTIELLWGKIKGHKARG